MTELAEQFEHNRKRLRALAYRILGSLADADDAVQETWLRLNRSDGKRIDNIEAWLTTVAAHVCLDMLRARKSHPEEPAGLRLPDPIVSRKDGLDPEQQALVADCIGLALLFVLQILDPAERIAYVLHDMFSVPFDEIAGVLNRSAEAARQLASRARKRVRTAVFAPDGSTMAQRGAVEAFITAARSGDLDALLAVLDPNIVLRADRGEPAGIREIRGARDVGERAVAFAKLIGGADTVLVNGIPGLVSFGPTGEPFSVLAFTIVDQRITEVYILADRARLRRLAL